MRGSAPADGDRLRWLPKAELHCHIEGAAMPALAIRQAERYGIDLSDILEAENYRWHDFTSFLAGYDRVSTAFRTEEDFALLAGDHLARLSACGTLYAEIFVSPDHARAAGLDAKAYVAGLAEGMRQAEAQSGIVSRMIVVGVRHLGAEVVETAAEFAARCAHPLVTGFGLAGDERQGRPRDFARAFDIARDAGLGLTAHAGELCAHEAVAETLDALRPERLGHGVRAAESPDLVSRIVEAGIVLEVCPGSNLALGLYPDLAAHPLRALHQAGAKVTVNADDPPFFATSLANEYRLAAEQGFSEAELVGLTRTAIEAAFVDAATRRQLLDRLQLAALRLGAPAAPA
ncbi:adenosine deaminase [Mangrovibrevibacter kandeliae]|uniref:adenosine deaminase n=1 Tax=Mangrovibrevibacter kandeliae TaxID=2968473 RepID=UPI002117634F|nr:adenosine deaminase [Aurantimonas sp. CSK15Z-1]